MLELRPTCEQCKKALPPHSTRAMICSFECTFCATSVETLLQGVCPNCGGNFSPRPIRPKTNWNDDNHLGKYPAGTRIVEREVDPRTQALLLDQVQSIAPEDR